MSRGRCAPNDAVELSTPTQIATENSEASSLLPSGCISAGLVLVTQACWSKDPFPSLHPSFSVFSHNEAPCFSTAFNPWWCDYRWITTSLPDKHGIYKRKEQLQQAVMLQALMWGLLHLRAEEDKRKTIMFASAIHAERDAWQRGFLFRENRKRGYWSHCQHRWRWEDWPTLDSNGSDDDEDLSYDYESE